MSTQSINISITVNGANPAARQIASVGNAARQAHGSIFSLRNLLLGFTIKGLTAEFIKFSDAATRISNRLNVLTGSQARSNELFDALFKVAQDTRSRLEPTIDAYARLERATVGLNLTGQQLIDLTKGINQSFQIFGNTAKESEAAMVQFSQGLSVGVLRGDELRSVLEQAPRLAKAIADGLNEIPEGKELSEKFGRLFRDFETGAISSEILAGGLRKLGASGKLTSEVISKALLTQLAKLNEEFARTAPTIENGFTMIQNAVTKLFMGGAFKSFSADIGKMLVDIADWITENEALLTTVGSILGDLVRLFAELISIGWEATMAIGNMFLDLAKTVLSAFGFMTDGGSDTAVAIVTFFMGMVKGITASLEGVFTLMSRGAAYIMSIFVSIATNVKLAFQKAFDIVLDASATVVNALIDAYNLLNVFTEDLKKVDWGSGADSASEEFVNVFDEAQAAAGRAEELVAKIFDPISTGVDKASAAVVQFAQTTSDRLKGLKTKVSDAVNPMSTLGNITGGKEALPAVFELNANDQRRLDSFNMTMDELREGSDDATKALAALNRVTKQYNALAANEEIAKMLPGKMKFEKEIAELRQRYSNEAVDQLKAEHVALGEAAQSSMDHYKAQRLLNEALKNGIPATQEQIDQLAAVLRSERLIIDAQRERDNILESLTRKADQYRAVLAATNELVGAGTLTETGQKRELAKTEVGRGVEDAKDFVSENSGNPFDTSEREIEKLMEERDIRVDFLKTAAEEDIANATMYEELRLEMIAAYAQKETEIRMEAQRIQYQNAATSFGEMADLSKDFVNESSGLYKTLFAISKGFAIADGFVKLNQAIMNASVALPFPANLAAMAQVGASGMALLSSIKSAASPDIALKDGGWVSGPGGPRGDKVKLAASDGEYVVNAAAAARNADLLEMINSGKFNAGQQPGNGLTLNVTQNITGVRDADGFRASGRQIADDTARAVTRAQGRN